MADHLVANNPEAYLSPMIVVNRLMAEFSYVDADGEEGRRWMLETIKRLKEKAALREVNDQMVRRLERVKNRTVYVCFGDDASSDALLLATYIVPGMPLIFEYASVAHENAVRHLLTRCAAALGYEVINDRRARIDPGHGGQERLGIERRSFTDRRSTPDRRRNKLDH